MDEAEILAHERPQEISTLVHADEPEKYDRIYYGEAVPDAYYQTWVDSVFYHEEMSAELIESRLWQDDNGSSHAKGGAT